MVPSFVNFLANKVCVKTPFILWKKCKKCGRCQKICPAKIISMDGRNNTAVLMDKFKCLHCFCCHEICPEGAIKLKRFM